MVYWLHEDWRGDSEDAPSVWMEKDWSGLVSVKQLVPHRCHSAHAGTSHSPERFYLPMNVWQAVHILPAVMVLVILWFTPAEGRREITDRVAIALLRLHRGKWGDLLCFIWHITRRRAPWAHEQNITHRLHSVFAAEEAFELPIGQGPPPPWMTGNQSDASTSPRCVEVCEQALTQKGKDLWVFLSPVVSVKLQLSLIHSDWMKVTLWFQHTSRHPVRRLRYFATYWIYIQWSSHTLI